MLRRFLDFISAHVHDDVLPTVTSCSHYFGQEFGQYGRKEFSCRAGWSVGSILANGDIFVCPNVERRPEWIQGNVRKDDFAEVWEQGFRVFRSPDMRKSSRCAACPDYEACRGDSLHTWNEDNRQPLMCFRERFPLHEENKCEITERELVSRLRPFYPKLCGLHVNWEDAKGKKVVFTPNATRELFQMFRWGTYHPINLSEQMGCLIGHSVSDYALVEFVAPVFLEARNTKEAYFSENSLCSAREEAQVIARSSSRDAFGGLCLLDRPCELLGFVHSHPGELAVIPSGQDVALQTHLDRDEALPLFMIVNPQKRRIAACWGAALQMSDIVFLTEESLLEQTGGVAPAETTHSRLFDGSKLNIINL